MKSNVVSLNNFDRDECYSFLHIADEDLLTPDYSDRTVYELMKIYCDLKKKQKPNLWRQYGSAAKKLEEFGEEFGCPHIMPIRITTVFWEYFISYMREQGMNYSTIDNYVGSIKGVLNRLRPYKIKLSADYDNVEVPKSRTTKIALSIPEILELYFFDFDKVDTYEDIKGVTRKLRKDTRNTLKRVRDMFVLSCALGQRHSDMIRISPEHFKDNVLSIIQLKTTNRANVDMSEMSFELRTAKDILKKYDYKAPYTSSIQRYDDHLKLMGKIVGGRFNDIVVVEDKVNGVIVQRNVPKWQLIGSHTARRTFATYNIHDFKHSAHTVMKATGHSTETSLNHYICDE